MCVKIMHTIAPYRARYRIFMRYVWAFSIHAACIEPRIICACLKDAKNCSDSTRVKIEAEKRYMVNIRGSDGAPINYGLNPVR